MSVPDYNENVVYPFNKSLEDKAPPEPLKSGDDGGTFGGMDGGERLGRIEKRLDTIEGEQRAHFRWFVTTTIALGALILGTTGFVTSRIDRADDRMSRLETNVNELPGKLASNLSQMNQTLFQAITAAKQAPPQVILLPVPELQQAAPPKQ